MGASEPTMSDCNGKITKLFTASHTFQVSFKGNFFHVTCDDDDLICPTSKYLLARIANATTEVRVSSEHP